MIQINIKEDFSPTTGFRTYEDGPKSGLEFYDTLLKSRFEEALNKGVKLKVILDGGEGYTSSFLNEAFRLLGQEFGADNVWNRLSIVSNEWPKYIEKIKQSVYEMEK
ncbi:STAS-like domain-containing protein [Flammeovirga sp. MY04]|uniref:STAS-like domain-containing protein n=1 Tax=Flammeovirga sp. MY04 TaxID=1191459 RepID=UPI000806217F|nr:STAS-like domain-containing protein [Flammeovirga sp. MY04]ANQ49576.1 STAS-like domain-containing protein [Flammeovirga sp. MY04]